MSCAQPDCPLLKPARPAQLYKHSVWINRGLSGWFGLTALMFFLQGKGMGFVWISSAFVWLLSGHVMNRGFKALNTIPRRGQCAVCGDDFPVEQPLLVTPAKGLRTFDDDDDKEP